MKTIYRTYADTEVSRLSTKIECPHCGDDWTEEDMDVCGKTYELECEKCGKKFNMYFDAS